MKNLTSTLVASYIITGVKDQKRREILSEVYGINTRYLTHEEVIVLSGIIKKAKQFVKWSVKKIASAKEGLKKEKVETKEMLQIFFKLLKNKLNLKHNSPPPTKEELKRAIAQLKDVGKVALVTAIMLGPIPGDEPLLIGLEMLARHFGITFFPSALQGLL